MSTPPMRRRGCRASRQARWCEQGAAYDTCNNRPAAIWGMCAKQTARPCNTGVTAHLAPRRVAVKCPCDVVSCYQLSLELHLLPVHGQQQLLGKAFPASTLLSELSICCVCFSHSSHRRFKAATSAMGAGQSTQWTRNNAALGAEGVATPFAKSGASFPPQESCQDVPEITKQ